PGTPVRARTAGPREATPPASSPCLPCVFSLSGADLHSARNLFGGSVRIQTSQERRQQAAPGARARGMDPRDHVPPGPSTASSMTSARASALSLQCHRPVSLTVVLVCPKFGG